MKPFLKRVPVFLLILVLLCAASLPALAAGYRYAHDPRLNPVTMADVVYDPEAIYGFSPSADSARLGSYASFDWSDESIVMPGRQERIDYHASIEELYELEYAMMKDGKNIEEIARSVSALRNEIRLRSYENNPEGLAAAKESNLAAYGNENGPTADSLYEKYGSWEIVLEKAFSVNSGMDACLGLYDDYYDLYLAIGQTEEVWYTDAMQWVYSAGCSDPAGAFLPLDTCTRAEAITVIWEALGCPEAKTAASFTDVASDSAFAPAISWAAGAGVTNGTGEGCFSPDAPLTRAMFITMLMRIKGEKSSGSAAPFKDTAPGAYYYDAAMWAKEQGVSIGTESGAFKPLTVCTHAEASVFLYRYINK